MSSFTNWLESTVIGLEREISSHPVFESDEAATPGELEHLRTLVVLHRFLSQELERRAVRRKVASPRASASHAA